jgi:hypothetical protein
MTGAASSLEPTLQGRARDLFLLQRAEREIRSLTPEQHDAVRQLFDAAQRRASAADDLSDDGTAAAFVLYQEAITLLIAAVLAARDARQIHLHGLRASVAFDALSELADAGRIPPLPEFVVQARTLLAEEDPLAFDRFVADDLSSQRALMEATLRWLKGLIEPRTLKEIRAIRIVRLLMVVLLMGCAIVWVVARVTRPKNIALHKPVTMNGRYPQSTAPADNTGFTNGEMEDSYGIHTSLATPGTFSWIMVDLGQPTSFKRVKVYNRADTLFDECLPMTMEFSDDAATFNVVDVRAKSFSSRSPWVYESKGPPTRYIRIRSDRYLALTELEVNP